MAPVLSGHAASRSQGSGGAVSRRAFLATGAVALAVGAAGTELGVMATSASPVAEQAPPPDVDLMAEHGVLKRVLLIYQEALALSERGQEPPTQAIHEGAEVIHDFIEGFHEALEEGYVFPRLRSAGKLVGTVDTLLVQHARGREITQLVLAGTSAQAMNATSTRLRVTNALAAFVRMYQPHEAREDTVVFPAFRAMLRAEELGELASTFAELQTSQFGRQAFSGVVDRVAAIERALDIYDLNQFTSPPVPT